MNDRKPARGASEDEPIRALRALAEVTPPPSLVPAVMRRVAEPRPLGLWGWLWKRRKLELRLSPVGLVGGLLASSAAVALAFVAVRPAPAPHTLSVAEDRPVGAAPAADSSAAPREVVVVRFVLSAKGARRVAVAGDFNGWNADATVLEPVDGDGTFVASVPLARGAYEYMFVVDGKWLTDPAAAERRPDGFGRVNGVLRL